jgi:hypothetical protein
MDTNVKVAVERAPSVAVADYIDRYISSVDELEEAKYKARAAQNSLDLRERELISAIIRCIGDKAHPEWSEAFNMLQLNKRELRRFMQR